MTSTSTGRRFPRPGLREDVLPHDFDGRADREAGHPAAIPRPSEMMTTVRRPRDRGVTGIVQQAGDPTTPVDLGGSRHCSRVRSRRRRALRAGQPIKVTTCRAAANNTHRLPETPTGSLIRAWPRAPATLEDRRRVARPGRRPGRRAQSRGSRVRMVVSELRGKIDIIPWNTEPVASSRASYRTRARGARRDEKEAR
jgi:hypothetical protein